MPTGWSARPDFWPAALGVLATVSEPGSDPSAFRPPASEKLDLELMVKGYTINGAYQLRMENQVGSIEVGKLADLVVLKENLFDMDRSKIHDIRPEAVMMEGTFTVHAGE